jgi:hypothetical protein
MPFVQTAIMKERDVSDWKRTMEEMIVMNNAGMAINR